MFSSRLPASIVTNAVSAAVGRVKQTGSVLFDLTETNPTAVGFRYPPDLLPLLADPAGLSYRPNPRGLDEARQEISAFYRRQAADVAPEHLILTASTSEAYAFLFKLLCNPGDHVHVPQPSYPLFDLLAGLEGVAAVPYRLHAFDAWTVDRDGLLRSRGPRSRVILVVSPNNPTGSMIRAADREWLVEIARERGLAIVADEVFADYRLSTLADATSLVGEDRVLTFTLGGLSKSAALPQLKLAWIAVNGPSARVDEAIERLDLIADTYLSVSTPVQLAAGKLLEVGQDLQRQVLARVRQNLECLRAVVARQPVLTLLEPEGGWSAVVRIPATRSEEQVVLSLVERAGVLVHPGYFFDFAEEAFLVLSLLPDPDVFREGSSRLAALVAEGAVS